MDKFPSLMHDWCLHMLQLPTQVYMAVLFAVLDLLLNFQHSWYCYWIIPRRKKRQLAQQNSTARTGNGEYLWHIMFLMVVHLGSHGSNSCTTV